MNIRISDTLICFAVFAVILSLLRCLLILHYHTIVYIRGYRYRNKVPSKFKDEGVCSLPLASAEKAHLHDGNSTENAWIWLIGPKTRSNYYVIVTSNAYYDDRRQDGHHYVRMHFIYDIATPKKFWKKIRFVAYQSKEKSQKKAKILKTFFINWRKSLTRKIKGREYGHCMMSLPVGSIEFVPDEILIYSESYNINSSIPVYKKNIEKPKVRFAICLKPMYGELLTSNIPRIIEWMEMNKILGVSEFHFYNASLQVRDKQVRAIFENYQKDITIHQFDAQFERHLGKLNRTVYNSRLGYSDEFGAMEVLSRAAFSHCIYTNYQRVEYLLLIDLDELLIPRMHPDYHHLMDYLLSNSSAYISASSIAFDVAIFSDELSRDESQPDYLHTLQYRNQITSRHSDQRERAVLSPHIKSFINPKTCVLAYHHGCVESVILPNVTTVALVSQELAMVHHYRHGDKFKHNVKNMVEDKIMFKFKAKLQIQVGHVLKKLNFM